MLPSSCGLAGSRGRFSGGVFINIYLIMKRPKKDAYIEAIHSLLVKRGVESLKMEDIAENIGVTKMTLYNNFRDKEALLEEILSYRGRHYFSFMSQIGGENLNAVQMLIKVLEFQSSHPMPDSVLFYRTFKRCYPEIFERHIVQLKDTMASFIKDNISQGVREGIYRDDFDPDDIITYIMGTMNDMFTGWVGGDKEALDLNMTHRQFINYHIRGVANEKGLEILKEELSR